MHFSVNDQLPILKNIRQPKILHERQNILMIFKVKSTKNTDQNQHCFVSHGEYIKRLIQIQKRQQLLLEELKLQNDENRSIFW